jgi:hypothetical protein
MESTPGFPIPHSVMTPGGHFVLPSQTPYQLRSTTEASHGRIRYTDYLIMIQLLVLIFSSSHLNLLTPIRERLGLSFSLRTFLSTSAFSI